MTVVLDTGVVVSGIFWRAESHRCLLAFARRKYVLSLTEPIFAEYVEVAWRLKEQEQLSTNPEPWLVFIRDKAKFRAPVQLRGPLCRDPKDDMFLECALGASASVVVSRDGDLLALDKPFGIAVLTPRQFLSLLGRR